MQQLPPDRSLRLEIADFDDPKKFHDVTGWQSWTITEDWFKGIPTFTAVPAPTAKMRGIIGPHSQRVKVYADETAYQFEGLTDERDIDTGLSGVTMDVSGRGLAGQLVDCSVPPKYDGQDMLNCAGLTLQQIAQRTNAIWELDVILDAGPARYIASGGNRKASKMPPGVGYWDPVQLAKSPSVLKWIDVQPAGTGTRKAVGKRSPYYKGVDRDKIRSANFRPGETPWQKYTELAKQVRAHVWSQGDGTVVIGQPCYQMDPAGAYGKGIWLKWDKARGKAVESNVRGIQLGTSGSERFSEYQVFGIAKPNKKSIGKELLTDGWSVYDPSPGFWRRSTAYPYLTAQKLYRPKVVDVKKLADPKLIRRLAMYEMERAAISAISIDVEIPMHHAPNGNLWVIDSMVEVYDELNDIYGPHYIVRVERRYQGLGNPPKGKTTMLKLIPPDVFLCTRLGDGSDFDPDTVSDAAYLEHMMQRIWW